jgi:hypothetical protein
MFVHLALSGDVQMNEQLLDDCGTFPVTPSTLSKLSNSLGGDFTGAFSPNTTTNLFSPHPFDIGFLTTPNQRFLPSNFGTPLFTGLDYGALLRTPDFLRTPPTAAQASSPSTGTQEEKQVRHRRSVVRPSSHLAEQRETVSP